MKIGPVIEDPTTNDIIRMMLDMHKDQRKAYDDFVFNNYGIIPTDILELCRWCWNYCRENFTYVVENVTDQTVRSLRVILEENSNVDSKHYAGFIAGVLDARRRAGDTSIRSIVYRFVSEKANYDIHHVFVVANIHINIDPLCPFDNHRDWAIERNYKI